MAPKVPSLLGIPFSSSSKSQTSAVILIMSVNNPPRPNAMNGIGMNISHGFSGLKPHHFRTYPTMERAVEMMKAFRFPNRSAIFETIGITKNAVATAVIVENQAGQL